ncbi:MAG: multiheme c-type cytochrome [Thermoanaerobaculia bacterium]
MPLFVMLSMLLTLAVPAAFAWDPVPVHQDRRVFMPGSQPGSVKLESPSWCINCHGDYDKRVEPGHNWKGSMMGQASRDPLFTAAFAAALQDSIWLLGNPNAGSLCLRCHMPTGWLAGRADPPNGTKLIQEDMAGVSCDLCHRVVDPMRGLGQPGVPSDAPGSSAASEAARTSAADLQVLTPLRLFDGSVYFDPARNLPRLYASTFAGYVEATSGQYVVDPQSVMRGPRWDAMPLHPVLYSRFHRSRAFCGSCHDVSNAAMANAASAGMPEQRGAAAYFHLERTFSEFMASIYGREGAVPAAKIGAKFVATCQDCHMPRVTGYASQLPMKPRSDLALHDLSGGNAWVLSILASADKTSSAYDPYNYAILSGSRYPGARVEADGLQGSGAALQDGSRRALDQLTRAADLVLVSKVGSEVTLRIVNHTGHKLISGFPEGRRMWLNVKFFDGGGALTGEINPYVPLETRLDASGNVEHVAGGQLVRTRDDLVYEAKMSSSVTGESDTFHFVLVTDRAKDNRIPPRGFDLALAAERLALPRKNGADAPDLFTPAEYEGGWDDVAFSLPAGTVRWTATLYYQTTSREYVEFLRDEINGTARTLTSPAPSGEAQAYIAQTDPYFTSVRDWGRAIWDLWLHNGGSAPVPMTSLSSSPGRRRSASH